MAIGKDSVETLIKEYPFLNYIKEDKSHYRRAKDAGYNDPNDIFLIGDSGGFCAWRETGCH